jgi:hypothetical protein
MGSQQSNIRIFAQDSEFDDIFAKYCLKEYTFIHYLVGDKKKFEGDALNAKQSLLKYMDMTPIDKLPTLFTDGNGNCSVDDINNFTEIVKEDLKSIVSTDGFTIQLVLTGQCAPLLNIIGNLLRDEYVTPAKLEIFVVNGKHNGQGLFKELLYLQQVTHSMATTLVIHEFNAFSSMGSKARDWIGEKKFVDCGTSVDFNKKIFDLANADNSFAKGIINYGIKFNNSLITKSVGKFNEAIKTFDELKIDHDLTIIAFDVDSYIKNLFNEDNTILNTDVCQRLSNDFQKVVNICDIELKKLNDGKDDKAIKVKLYHIRGWFAVKASITKSNLVQFPFHDMAAVLMYRMDTSLIEFVSYGVGVGEFFDIIRESPTEQSVEVIHYVAQDPEKTRQIIEDIIINIITEKK